MSTLFEKLTTTVTSRYASMSVGQKVLAGFGAVATGVVTYIAYYRITEKMKPFNSYTTSGEAINGLDLTDKYAIVTGSNTGIGKETAKILYKQNCNVIMACRNTSKAEEARNDIVNSVEASKGTVTVLKLDLSSLKSVNEFATEFSSKYKELNYLINNAGIMALPEYKTSTDGYELQFAVNHIGHFYLFRLLENILIKSKGRLVSLSSVAHRRTTFDIYEAFLNTNDAPSEKDYNEWINYGISKTSNILFAREVDRRYKEKGVTACSLHPGWVDTELARNIKIKLSQIPMFFMMFLNLKFFMDNKKSIPQGAANTLRCVSMTNNELQGGHYYHNCNSGRDGGQLSGAAKTSLQKGYENYEKESIEGRLWTLSEKLITDKGFKLTL